MGYERKWNDDEPPRPDAFIEQCIVFVFLIGIPVLLPIVLHYLS